MITFENKILTVFVNILLGIYQILCWVPGIIGLTIFRKAELYKNPDNGVTVIKVNKGYLFGGACFSCGPIIFVTPTADVNTLRHETGHSVQSLFLGPLFHILVSIPSVIRFWIRRKKGYSMEWYYSAWPEGGKFGAEKLGHTHRD